MNWIKCSHVGCFKMQMNLYLKANHCYNLCKYCSARVLNSDPGNLKRMRFHSFMVCKNKNVENELTK